MLILRIRPLKGEDWMKKKIIWGPFLTDIRHGCLHVCKFSLIVLWERVKVHLLNSHDKPHSEYYSVHQLEGDRASKHFKHKQGPVHAMKVSLKSATHRRRMKLISHYLLEEKDKIQGNWWQFCRVLEQDNFICSLKTVVWSEFSVC